MCFFRKRSVSAVIKNAVLLSFERTVGTECFTFCGVALLFIIFTILVVKPIQCLFTKINSAAFGISVFHRYSENFVQNAAFKHP